MLFDVLVGSILFGIGVGILIRLGASSGGMVIPALMIASYKNWSPGKVMMGINLFIFLLTSLVIDYKIVIYAIICQFFSTNIIDFINEMKLPKGSSLSLNWRKR
ncbi:YitT family protein [Heyndrickxia oleronia]|uniref:YitT family protein n=1 Tax=Heyndrickxia oleronia TaxID=38875 RepID=UPI00242E20B3|nr:YitT family protein [Heyndrickxia oleronia]